MPITNISTLPDYLRERVRVHQDKSCKAGGFVVYWMRTSVRADENPALDVAMSLAHQLDAELLVYQAISPHYEFASDRHHTFMLEGARDVQAQLRQRNISYAFHLATAADTGSHLVSLAENASLLVTEDMPVDPSRRFLKALVKKVDTAVICVDTACVVPMQLQREPFTRAYKFRDATKALYAERLNRLWPGLPCSAKPFDVSLLPFEPVDLQTADISELVASCNIDHTVGPVVDTPGGSEYGYSRWNNFKSNGLSKYAGQRNNALVDGVSRLSAYLHYGMVSPMRIAREAAALGNAGSEKYLDELLIWRELAYGFCFYREDHDQWSAIPDWAQKTLQSHACDQREAIYSWEQLARAQTSDTFWNTAQQSLLMQGELHNNVRMTWGKAILKWTGSPQTALNILIDLNHRYALDGRDPASYGGLLWCLGQFDRPFEPEQKIFGSVRPRSTTDHAKRLDTVAYQKRVRTPRFEPLLNVAIIGAGISGLFAARTLQDHGVSVTVFEKGRGVGGRMSTRRIDEGGSFDHGAQYFTVRDHNFKRYVESWMQQGIVAEWPDQNVGAEQKIVVLKNAAIDSESGSQDRYVATPAMNSICKHLAADIDVRTKTRIEKIVRTADGIELMDDTGSSMGIYDRLIVSAPAEQTLALLGGNSQLTEQISKIGMNPCWATMVSFPEAITEQWVGAFVHDSFISWVARNNTKPGRNNNADHLVIHATPEWTAEHWELAADEVAKEMLQELWRATGLQPQVHTHRQAHRWKYAIPIDPPDAGCFVDECGLVIVCGDWASGSRVEGAALSGMAAAGRILGRLEVNQKLLAPSQGSLFTAG